MTIFLIESAKREGQLCETCEPRVGCPPTSRLWKDGGSNMPFGGCESATEIGALPSAIVLKRKRPRKIYKFRVG